MCRTASNRWQQWSAAAADPTIDAAIRGLYADLDDEVARQSPTCWLSGKCCQFQAYGHQLYVTGLEIAWVLHQLAPSERSADHEADPITSAQRLFEDQPELPSCPFQHERLCTVHAVRPMGCRIFFCQQGTATWQQSLYERLLRRLRRMHDQFELTYQYMEWRQGLREALAVYGREGPAA